MNNIELVIKIPESEIPKQQDIIEIPLHFIDGKVCEAGGYEFDVLSKGHGRIIAEPTEGDISKTIGGQNDFAECIREAVKAVFDNAQTIIEADKAESEDMNER